MRYVDNLLARRAFPILVVLLGAFPLASGATSGASILANTSPALLAPSNVTPTISISDPCVCKNNATTLTNGQFGETIQITSNPGEIWLVTAVNGLYSASSPNPPAAPVPIALGTSFAETSPGIYLLNGIHVDALGYSLQATISPGGTNLMISNSCKYPDPTITTPLLANPICLNSSPLNLTGNPGDANILSAGFTIDNQPATVFDPSALGTGPHTVIYSVNGGTPKAAGPLDPGCVQAVGLVVDIVATPTTLTCDDNVQISLDTICTYAVQPDDILEGTYGCWDDYQVILTGPGGQNYGNTITPANIGQTLTATVKHLPSGNSCWGNVHVEDKLAPKLICNDLTVNCAMPDFTPEYLAQHGFPLAFPNQMPFPAPGVVVQAPGVFTVGQPTVALFENCSNIVLQYSDVFVNLNCGQGAGNVPDASGYIVRTWSATDASGNTTICVQHIYIQRVHASAAMWPPDITISCVNPDTTPANTGVPFVQFLGQNWPIFPSAGQCEMAVTYTDVVFRICDGSRKILRTWSVIDWCLPINPTPPNPNPNEHVQLIVVMDNMPPQLTCPPSVTISTDAYKCNTKYNLPDLFITDACSRIDTVLVQYSFGGTWHPLPDSTPVQLVDFLGNNPWNPDTFAIFPCLWELPSGTVAVHYDVKDDCGNVTQCDFNIEVLDNQAAVAHCKTLIVDTLETNGTQTLTAAQFDDGSYANCTGPWFKVRRVSPDACMPNDKFYDVAIFCCSDIGDTVLVDFRAYSTLPQVGPVDTTWGAGSYTDCITKVVIRDNTPPTCTPPPAPNGITCDNLNKTFPYGNPVVGDNCGVKSVTLQINYAPFDTICFKGAIERIWTVTDSSGLKTQCSQKIAVSNTQNYWLKMPDDIVTTHCAPGGSYGVPTFNKIECERMKTVFTDQVVAPVPGACYRIDRTWTIYNSCAYNPSTACVQVPNPQPITAEDDPGNLIGPTLSPAGTAAPWAPSSIKLTPTAPTATNFSTFWSATANCYKFTQRIKINDTTWPDFTAGCSTPINGCDATTNDPLLWNNPAWFDPATGSNNLAEGPLSLEIQAKDDCSGSNVAINGFLFLNLDADTIQETVLRLQDFPLNPGVVPFDNYQNPNYMGGALTQFDNRPVPVNDRYRFALRQTVNAGVRRATILWNTISAPTTYVTPQLPHGRHKIQWNVTDGCGNTRTCVTQFHVRECTPPQLTCGPVGIVLNGGPMKVFPADFVVVATDNYTPTNKLIFGFRIHGTGSGFPIDPNTGLPISSLTFDCADVGDVQIDLWVKDLDDNVDSCTTVLHLVDNGACAGTAAAPKGTLKVNPSDSTSGVQAAKIDLVAGGGSPISFSVLSDSLGNFVFPAVPFGTNFTLTPSKLNDPLNGVSTYDLLLFNKYILGVDTLSSPYKVLAADVNRSGSVTTYDLLELRKLILGIYTDFPNNSSWRFFPKIIAPSGNPFQDSIPEFLAVPNFDGSQVLDFVGVKIGDANSSAKPNMFSNADDRGVGEFFFDLKNLSFRAGDTVAATFRPSQKLACQLTLNFEKLELLDIQPSGHLRREYFAIFPEKNCLTLATETADEFTLIFRAKTSGKLENALHLSSQITPVAAFLPDGKRLDVALKFARENNAGQPQLADFQLLQNSPNPSNGRTNIAFQLPEDSEATFTFSDPEGRVCHMFKGSFTAGWQEISLKKGDLPPGVWFYKIEAAGHSAVRKMVVF